MLSFAIVAGLHRYTHDFLFTARALSWLGLLASAVLVGLIVRALGASARSAILSGLFCLAVFCADVENYVGQDDPQIFAQAFFLAALLLYITHRRSLGALAAVAFVMVVGASVKHNLVDIPLAVALDLILISRLRAAWFLSAFTLFGLVSAWANLHFGGPAFLAELLAPREYSFRKSLDQYGNVLAPILLPFAVAAITAWSLRKDPRRRLLAILLLSSLALGGYFGGGRGVSVNALFSSLLAVSILLGLFFDRLWSSPAPAAPQALTASRERTASLTAKSAPYAAPLIFLWLLIPLILSGNWNLFAKSRELHEDRSALQIEVRRIAAQPGPALCESLLRCFLAGKPYLYDPFNATRLIRFRHLDPAPLIDQINHQTFGVIQFDGPLDRDVVSDRFPPEVLAAITSSYHPTLVTPASVLYLPNQGSPTAVNLGFTSLAGSSK